MSMPITEDKKPHGSRAYTSDAYWEGFCKRCGRVRMVCDTLSELLSKPCSKITPEDAKKVGR